MAQQLALDGLQRRDDALELLEKNRAMWLFNARNVAAMVCRLHGQVMADDIRARCPIPEGWDHRVVGAVFSDRRFVKMGYQATERPEAHARPIAIFKLRQDTVLLDWA
ncbi:MAG: hypothetical protein E3J29_00215 [Dehalococcoidia bacterium]|nr:MAG: hypothetical protein E3J29_00215 [Dehalococcoidia bacterium]